RATNARAIEERNALIHRNPGDYIQMYFARSAVTRREVAQVIEDAREDRNDLQQARTELLDETTDGNEPTTALKLVFWSLGVFWVAAVVLLVVNDAPIWLAVFGGNLFATA